MKDINNIWKFLQQQLASEEQQSLEKWKNQSEENLDLFNDIHELWTESEQLEDIKIFDAEMGWEEIEERLKKKIALSLDRCDGLLSLPLLLYSPERHSGSYQPDEIVLEPMYESFTAIDQDEEFQLADSSIVFLDEGSSIRYFTRIDESLEDRRVFLEGKATFDIASNDSLPFVVQASKTGIKALGTIFNVENKDSNDISVENIEGLIKFYELLNEANAVTLKQGEKFNYNGEGFVDKAPKVEKKVIKVIEKNYTIQELWYELLLKFENKILIRSYGSLDPKATIRINLNQTLPSIIKTLESNSKIEIDFKKTCPDCYDIKSLKIVN